jgi:antirestriction protein ArdC
VEPVQSGAELAKITNVVANALDRGEIPWRIHHLPRHVSTGKVFGGVNAILLQIAARRLGCTSPFWASAADWHSLGCKLLHPQRAGHVLSTDPPAQEAVYNWEQTDRSFSPPTLTCDAPADVLERIISRAGVKVHYHYQPSCVYNVAEDCIRMPHKIMFALGPGGEIGFLDALGHELFHWSEPRVGWQAPDEVNELRAEVGSGLLLGALGIQPLPLHLARHHRRFAPVWSLLLRFQPSLLYRVCRDVVATLDWLLAFAGKSIPWEANLSDHHREGEREVRHVPEGCPEISRLR